MPVLPTYDSQKNIEARPVAPVRNEVEAQFAGQNQLIQTASDITSKWIDAQNVMQATEAKSKYEVATAQIQAQAAADPDFNNAPKYQKMLQDAKAESLKGISSGFVQNQLAVEFDYGNQLADIKINAQFGVKQIENNKYNLATYITEQQSKKAVSSPTEIEQINKNIELNLTTQVAYGLIDQETADKMLLSSEKQAAEDLVYSDPLRGREAINRGIFRLEPKDKQELINRSYSIEKGEKEFADFQMKQTQTSSVITLSEALQNGNLTPMMVREMQQGNLIDSDTAAIFDSIALNKKYDIPSDTQVAEPDYFLRLIDDSNGDKVQIKKVLADAAKAYSDNKIGKNQFLYFVQNAKETFDRQSKGIFTKSPEQVAMYNAIEGVKSAGKTILDAATYPHPMATMVKKFFDRLGQNGDPERVKAQVIDEAITEQINKSKLNIPKTSVRMVTPDGKMIDVMPDKVDAAIKRGLTYAR
jgi:hypothetical protein